MASKSFTKAIQLLKYISMHKPILLHTSKILERAEPIQWNPVICQKYSTRFRKEGEPFNTLKNNNPVNRSGKENEPKITLISNDNNVTITSLQDAQKLSRRRDLKLVKMIDLDTKTQRPVYKLMSGAEFFEEDKNQRLLKAAKKQGSIKGEKMVTLSYKITEHDLLSRVKNILKWLAKNYEARVIINGDASSMALAENVYQVLEDAVKDQGRIVQKRQKGNDIRFQIIPPKKEGQEHLDHTRTSVVNRNVNELVTPDK